MRIARASGHDEGVAAALGNLSSVASMKDEMVEAERWAREALTLAKAIQREEMIATTSLNLASILVEKGATNEGMPHALRGLDILTRLGSPYLTKAREILAECEAALAAE